MKAWNLFKKSFKLDMRFIYVILLDLIFYAIMAPVAIISVLLIKAKADTINMASVQAVLASPDATPEQAAAILADFRSLFIIMLVAAVVFLLALLFSYALSRTLLWNYLLKKKFRAGKYFKFILMTLLLVIPLGIIMLLPFVLIAISYWTTVVIWYVMLILVLYFLFALYIEFTKTGKIFRSIGRVFKGINENSFVAFLLCLLVYFILFVAYTLFSLYVLPGIGAIVVYMILLLLFCAWMRLYVLKVHG
jgi:hypothetical protein